MDKCPLPSFNPNAEKRFTMDYGGKTKLLITVDLRKAEWQAEIDNIETKERLRRRGEAARIWNCAEAQLGQLGIKRVTGSVWKVNKPAIEFWKRTGFSFHKHKFASHWLIAKEIE